MSFRRYAARRIGFALLSTVVVMTAMFLVLAFVRLPAPGTVFGGKPPGVPSDGSIPLYVRYVDWMTQFLTLNWGSVRGSPSVGVLGDRPVPPTIRTLVAQRLLVTATYAVPGFLGAILFGLIVGYDGATAAGSVRDQLGRLVVYAVFALPVIVVSLFAFEFLVRDVLVAPTEQAIVDATRPPWAPFNLVRSVVPAALVTAAFVGPTARHARSATLDRLDTDVIRLVRAKGGGPLTVARHVARRVVGQLVAAVVAETLGIVLLAAIMIEIAFEISGFGRLVLFAAVERQPSLIAAVTFVTALLGIGGNLLADLLRAAVDPRTTEDGP
ncbi:MAG: ABC transporter permease subunit [Halobaculum sp.]